MRRVLRRFENVFEYSNDDGITCVAARYSQSDYSFVVEAAAPGDNDGGDDDNDDDTDGGSDTGTGAGREVIIDNRDPGVSSTGKWKKSGGKKPYGADSLWSRDADATFTFNAALDPVAQPDGGGAG